MIKIAVLTVLLGWPGFGRFIFQEAGPWIDFREEYHHWEGNIFPQTSFPTLAVPFLGTTLCGPGLHSVTGATCQCSLVLLPSAGHSGHIPLVNHWVVSLSPKGLQFLSSNTSSSAIPLIIKEIPNPLVIKEAGMEPAAST